MLGGPSIIIAQEDDFNARVKETNLIFSGSVPQYDRLQELLDVEQQRVIFMKLDNLVFR